jgi:hypothetical protein
MQLTCPECKNLIDLSNYPEIKEEVVVECNMCGITLQVTKVDGETVEAEVIDEGK